MYPLLTDRWLETISGAQTDPKPKKSVRVKTASSGSPAGDAILDAKDKTRDVKTATNATTNDKPVSKETKIRMSRGMPPLVSDRR